MPQLGPQAQRYHLHTQMSSQSTSSLPPGGAKEFAPLLSARGVKERLLAYGLQPNKALGQNFLINETARDAMLEGLGALPAYEIGPGLGALTQGLLRGGRQVTAVEKDAAMARILEETLGGDTLRVMHRDALLVRPAEIAGWMGGAPFCVAGNLPYYITSQLVLQLLGSNLPILQMVLMVQEEAAARFFARPGERVYGPLRVLCACSFEAKLLTTLSPADYFPQPAVRSAVVRLEGDIRKAPGGFSAFLQGAFAMRRKTLLNNLLQIGLAREPALDAVSQLGLPADIRASAMEPMALLELYELVKALIPPAQP